MNCSQIASGWHRFRHKHFTSEAATPCPGCDSFPAYLIGSCATCFVSGGRSLSDQLITTAAMSRGIGVACLHAILVVVKFG
eukprot:6199969-Pleurochrysis_carterae.AAC.3